MGVRGRGSSDRSRTTWTLEMDRYFIDLMLEQIRKESRIDDHLFSKRAWKYMTTLFNAKFKFEYDKDVLKNRHKTLRNLYKAINNLLDQKGFAWDEARQMVTADNKVWDDYIKVHPDARTYRIRTIPYYNDLCVIYENACLHGKALLSSHDANDEGNIPESETIMSLEGLESSAADVENREQVETFLELSQDLVGNKDGRIIPLNVNEGTVEDLHEIVIDEKYSMSTGKPNDEANPQPIVDSGSRMGSRLRTYWQPPMDRYFIDLMLEQVQKGNQVDGLFHKQSWMEMIGSFNAKFGFDYDIDILKNRYKTMRRQYNAIKNLLDLDGFVWDETRQMVTADDCVWQDYIKVRPDARQYMTRPVPYYKDLCAICGESSGDGREGILSHNQDQGKSPEVQFGRSSKNLQSPAASIASEDQMGCMKELSHGSEKNTLPDQKKRRLENSAHSEHSKRVWGNDRAVASSIHETGAGVSSMVDKKKDGENSSSVDIKNVVEAIQALPDMDEDLILDACDLLEDEKKAKTFLALDVKLKKKWLIRKLRPQQ